MTVDVVGLRSLCRVPGPPIHIPAQRSGSVWSAVCNGAHGNGCVTSLVLQHYCTSYQHRTDNEIIATEFRLSSIRLIGTNSQSIKIAPEICLWWNIKPNTKPKSYNVFCGCLIRRQTIKSLNCRIKRHDLSILCGVSSEEAGGPTERSFTRCAAAQSPNLQTLW